MDGRQGCFVSVFGTYSKYYDLLYRDKDYQGEADFVHTLIQKYAPGTRTILDLGCGTGRHDIALAGKDYVVTGVDVSEEMLTLARSGLASFDLQPAGLDFVHGDIRNLRLKQQFDAVISLFHVMSYQTTNDDLKAAFETARIHLNPGRIFLFDCWYGPSVLADRPVVRIKKLENERIQVIRVAEPVMHPNKNLVDVNYTVWVKDRDSNKVEEIRETHTMRYWFTPEIEFLLAASGFELVDVGEWMTGEMPGFGSWSVYFVGRL